MDQRPTVILTGNDLTIEEIVAIGVGDKQVALDPAALERCRASRRFLEEEVAARRIIYGVNTSFGPMCNKIIEDREIETLQINLIRSHAAGLGDPSSPTSPSACWLVRLNTLVKGYSGVRIELLEFMRELINRGIAPYIPECGSVGASGDLIHLAHMALGMIGEGQVYDRGTLRPAARRLRPTRPRPDAPLLQGGDRADERHQRHDRAGRLRPVRRQQAAAPLLRHRRLCPGDLRRHRRRLRRGPAPGQTPSRPARRRRDDPPPLPGLEEHHPARRTCTS